MRGGLWYNVRMKAVYWLPAAALAGFIAGGWGAREELRALRELSESDEAKAVAKSKPDGFDAFASIMRIPDEAKRLPSRKEKGKTSRNAIAATNRAPSAATRPVAAPTKQAATNRTTAAMRLMRPEDLQARIEDAQDLWATRVEVARAQWKSKLKLDGKSEAAFDAALQEMNEKLYDSMDALATIIGEQESMTPELGLRLLSETTALLAETYDRVGECVAPELRSEVSTMNLADFIDPGVAEPLVRVQDKLGGSGFAPRGGSR